MRTKYGIVESDIYDGGMMLFKQKDYYKKGEIDMFKEKLLKDVMNYIGVKDMNTLEVIYAHWN